MCGLAAGIADGGGKHAFDALKDGLNAPETAAGEDRGFVLAGFPATGGGDDVMNGRRNGFFAC